MSTLEPLKVTLELPASEFIEHEGAPMVRCPINRVWVPLADYYSEKQGQLLPLVGNVDYQEIEEHWVEEKNGETGEIKMAKVKKENPVVWKETVRILEAPPVVAAEGGTLSFNVSEKVGIKDKMA